MTSDHLDDDALSATLDGEATPAELAHLDGCDVCEGRAGQLRRAATLIGRPVPAADDERREATIRTALAAAPTVLATRRRAMPQWLAAAAALLVLVAFGGLLLQVAGGGGDDEDTAASSFDAQAEKDESAGGDADFQAPTAGRGAEESEAAAPESGTAAAAPAPGGGAGAGALDGGDVGSLDGDQLRVVVERHVRTAERTAPADDTASSTTAAPPCEAEVRSTRPPLGPLRFVARATLEGTEALLLVFDELDSDAVLAVAVAPADCSVRRSGSFPPP